MKIIGIDLSGPTNNADTCLAAFEVQQSQLIFLQSYPGLDDQQLLDIILRFSGDDLIIGIDAPLSYQPGGGDRASDKELRDLIRARGGGVGVMTPTMTRMSYLTLRGVAITRLMEMLDARPKPRIVEVHPGAVLLLRGAPASDVRAFKHDPPARSRLLSWLESQGLSLITTQKLVTDHFVAACAAGLGAWRWDMKESAWIYPARPPLHPYDFAC